MLSFPTIHLAKNMPFSAVENAIMTIGEVADYLKVTERTIYRLAGAKQIPAFKVGGSWRFSRGDIEAWIRQQSGIGAETSSPPEQATRGRL
jgi:excisionase family DNA binding protein